MKIYLTKANIITICITIAAASLFVALGVYLMRDEPVKIPPYKDPVVISGTTTERYGKIFEDPLNPKIYPEEHKAVYEKIALHMPFDVWYPTQMPEGYYLTQASTHSIYANAKENNLYSVIYINTTEQKIISIEGEKGSFTPDDHEELTLSDTTKGVFLDAMEGPITLYVYSTDSLKEDSRYYVRSNNPNTTKEDLMGIGKYLKSL
ncbi:MAG: hypothetical protein KAS07_04915 [Candidatus Pacebacteria bacterium]|nr:hypothetical protein [Candidatus Paceibacterota bacterium]